MAAGTMSTGKHCESAAPSMGSHDHTAIPEHSDCQYPCRALPKAQKVVDAKQNNGVTSAARAANERIETRS